MKALNIITLVLLIVGGINWGLVGLFGFDLVAALTGATFGELNAINRLIYAVVGLCALVQIMNVAMIARAPEGALAMSRTPRTRSRAA